MHAGAEDLLPALWSLRSCTCCIEVPVRHGHERKAPLAIPKYVCQLAQKTVSVTGHSGWPAWWWRSQDSTASQGTGSDVSVDSLYSSCTQLNKSTTTQPVRS